MDNTRRRRWRIEPQIAHLLRGSMAAQAPAFENRLNLFKEVLRASA
jgi:hypothetical protein